jgi:hypothetical protein
VAFCYNSKVTAQSVGPQYLLPGATVHNQGPKVQPLGQSSPPGAKFRFKGRTRVTRLGEFSPIGRLFALCSFFENYGCSPQFWATFSVVKVMY